MRCVLMRMGGDGVGGAMEQTIANMLGAVRSSGGFHHLIGLFTEFPKPEIESLLLVSAADTQVQVLAGLLLCNPAFRMARRVGIVPTQNFVADFHAALLGAASWFNAGHGPRGILLTLNGKTQKGADEFLFLQDEPCLGKNFRVRKRFSAADVFGEKVVERTSGNFFGNETNIEAVAIELSGLGEILIHGAHHVVETALVIGTVANKDIQQNAED